MAAAAAQRLGSRIRAGLVIGAAPAACPQGFASIVGGHPLPTAASEEAGRQALALADSLAPDETLLVLLSGGASALMAVPAHGVTLDDKRATTERLLLAGADIHALNTVRKHLSAIKGGWLAARTRGACRALAISDVVGRPERHRLGADGGRRQPLSGRARRAPAVWRSGRLSSGGRRPAAHWRSEPRRRGSRNAEA